MTLNLHLQRLMGDTISNCSPYNDCSSIKKEVWIRKLTTWAYQRGNLLSVPFCLFLLRAVIFPHRSSSLCVHTSATGSNSSVSARQDILFTPCYLLMAGKGDITPENSKLCCNAILFDCCFLFLRRTYMENSHAIYFCQLLFDYITVIV